MAKKTAEKLLKGVAVVGASVGGASIMGEANMAFAEELEDTSLGGDSSVEQVVEQTTTEETTTETTTTEETTTEETTTEETTEDYSVMTATVDDIGGEDSTADSNAEEYNSTSETDSTTADSTEDSTEESTTDSTSDTSSSETYTYSSEEESLSEAISQATEEYDSASTSFAESGQANEQLEELRAQIEAAYQELQAVDDSTEANSNNLSTKVTTTYTVSASGVTANYDEDGNVTSYTVNGSTLSTDKVVDNEDGTYTVTESEKFYYVGDYLTNLLVQYTFLQEGYVGDIQYSEWYSDDYNNNYVMVTYTDAQTGETKTAYFDYVTVDAYGNALVSGQTVNGGVNNKASIVEDIMVVKKDVEYTATNANGSTDTLTYEKIATQTVTDVKVDEDGNYLLNGEALSSNQTITATEDEEGNVTYTLTTVVQSVNGGITAADSSEEGVDYSYVYYVNGEEVDYNSVTLNKDGSYTVTTTETVYSTTTGEGTNSVTDITRTETESQDSYTVTYQDGSTLTLTLDEDGNYTFVDGYTTYTLVATDVADSNKVDYTITAVTSTPYTKYEVASTSDDNIAVPVMTDVAATTDEAGNVTGYTVTYGKDSTIVFDTAVKDENGEVTGYAYIVNSDDGASTTVYTLTIGEDDKHNATYTIATETTTTTTDVITGTIKLNGDGSSISIDNVNGNVTGIDTTEEDGTVTVTYSDGTSSTTRTFTKDEAGNYTCTDGNTEYTLVVTKDDEKNQVSYQITAVTTTAYIEYVTTSDDVVDPATMTGIEAVEDKDGTLTGYTVSYDDETTMTFDTAVTDEEGNVTGYSYTETSEGGLTTTVYTLTIGTDADGNATYTVATKTTVITPGTTTTEDVDVVTSRDTLKTVTGTVYETVTETSYKVVDETIRGYDVTSVTKNEDGTYNITVRYVTGNGYYQHYETKTIYGVWGTTHRDGTVTLEGGYDYSWETWTVTVKEETSSKTVATTGTLSGTYESTTANSAGTYNQYFELNDTYGFDGDGDGTVSDLEKTSSYENIYYLNDLVTDEQDGILGVVTTEDVTSTTYVHHKGNYGPGSGWDEAVETTTTQTVFTTLVTVDSEQVQLVGKATAEAALGSDTTIDWNGSTTAVKVGDKYYYFSGSSITKNDDGTYTLTATQIGSDSTQAVTITLYASNTTAQKTTTTPDTPSTSESSVTYTATQQYDKETKVETTTVTTDEDKAESSVTYTAKELHNVETNVETTTATTTTSTETFNASFIVDETNTDRITSTYTGTELSKNGTASNTETAVEKSGDFDTKGYYYYSTQDYKKDKDDYSSERSDVTSRSISLSELKSESGSLSTSISEATSTSISQATSTSISEATSTSISQSTSTSISEVTSTSVSESASTSVSESTSTSVSESTSTSVSESTSTSISESTSTSASDSASTSESESESTSTAESEAANVDDNTDDTNTTADTADTATTTSEDAGDDTTTTETTETATTTTNTTVTQETVPAAQQADAAGQAAAPAAQAAAPAAQAATPVANIADAQVPLAVVEDTDLEDEITDLTDDETIEIQDEEVAKAIDAGRVWWYWILIIIGLITGKTAYDKDKKRFVFAEKDDDKKE